MLVARFMGTEEWKKINCGMELTSEKRFKCRTASTGFCFIPLEKIEDINFVFSFLNGIVSDDFVIIFETKENSNLRESWGVYADPMGSWGDVITVTEYCTNKYSIETLTPIAYGVIDKHYHWNVFQW